MQTSNKELILLVDDDPGNLKRAQTILGEEFRISATTSGKMALSLLSKVTPDLILLDVNMPEMNGFETLKKIRELENGSMIPVVFLTGDNDAETETKCFEAGAMDFVGKPFVSQVLVSRVKRILENRQYQNHLEEMVASQVAEMTRIKDSVFFEMPIPTPDIDEQEKIGEYFSSLDHLITLHQRKCNWLKKLKEYMLKNIFQRYK